MPYTGGFPAGGEERTVRGKYSFAVDGGAVGDIALSGLVIPSGAIIMTGFIKVDTILASGGSPTVALYAEAAGDLLAATAFGSSPWSTTGRKSVIPVGTGAASVATTADRAIKATIATATLTGGIFEVVLFYIKLYD